MRKYVTGLVLNTSLKCQSNLENILTKLYSGHVTSNMVVPETVMNLFVGSIFIIMVLWIMETFALTLSCIMPKNGQTYFKNRVVFTLQDF